MGASGWDYRTPYTPDLAEALEALRTKVFAENDYYWSGDDEAGRPGSIDELWEDETVQEEGTHSILDISTVIGETDEDDSYTLRPLTRDETTESRPLPTSKATMICTTMSRAGAGMPSPCTPTASRPST